ncbi:M3 family metallopeptidase [Shewanella algae]|uniref:M3 family metallopeptidase n=1 Tax=Shewanella algae TaxID=38313 RepID=UPI001AAD3A36|nr:M3 family metallopeptidase [Shewanella algae]MBO2645218.1 M3 family metallopeptidase [Shewanella algae]MBO2691794.1 M3 family metallopeptidase [Shewanella algae]MDV2960880.1 M3 family metallopeptidase [Shewanella algae]QTE92390.1 M3 family metallopeptidase [Shewanella algae]
MRKTLIATAIGAALVLSACAEQQTNETVSNAPAKEASQSMPEAKSTEQTASNVLLSPSPLQYHAPQFDKIKIADYLPAFEAGIKEHNQQIAGIINNSEAASFDNTIVAMEKTGAILNRTSRVFFNLAGLISNDEFQAIQGEIVPKLTEHSDNIFLNPKLFARVEAVYNHKDSLSAQDQRLVDFYYNQFVRAGAKLSEADKTQMRELNGELATLSTEFSQNILKSFKDDVILVTDKAQLKGLSEDEIGALANAAKEAGKEGYLISLVNTTRQPLLSSLEDRGLREKIWQTSANRAMASNGPIVLKQAQLRAEKAKLLGYETWADYVLADQMAGNPDAVFAILDDLAPKAVTKAKAEGKDIQAQIKASGADFELQPWDWAFYAEQVRKAKYDLDESQIKPYFEFNTVLNDGMFYAMQKFYGITMKERKDLPVWQEDVRAWEVFNEDGSSIGLFYLDPYARVGKNGGAWMDEYVTQSFLLDNKPVVYNALNIPKPAEGQPTLMTFDEVTTMFHEFGHGIHGLFSQVKYPSLAGTATPRDFVEFPSQANEDWATDPDVLAHYAKHYKTGEPIPKALLEKVRAAATFNQGYDTVEYLAAALLDMEWHSLKAGEQVADVKSFEAKARAKHGLNYAPVLPRYQSTYFSHVFGGGYSAGYYAYLWTEVFAADAFAHTMAEGGLKRANGDKYRQAILSKGNSEDLMQDYIQFRGQKPTVDALLKRRGLVD